MLIAVGRFGDTLPCFSPYLQVQCICARCGSALGRNSQRATCCLLVQDLIVGTDSSISSEQPAGFAVLLWACVALLAGGFVTLVVLFFLEGNEVCDPVNAAEDEDIAALDTDTEEVSFAAAVQQLSAQFWLFVAIGAMATAAYSPFIIYAPDLCAA